MAALYVTSISEKAGKTMLCAGLGKSWLSSGKRVGYLKLLAGMEKKVDSDAEFIQRLLSQEPADQLVAIPPEMKETCARVSRDKDVVIIEGLPLNVSGKLIEDVGAQVLVIHDYGAQLAESIAEYKKIGKRLLGVVINKVPRSKTGQVQTLAESLSQSGIQFLGSIPEDRILMALTVTELADILQGEIIFNADKSGELIENFMLGALTFDSGEDYFNRKNNKAVILKGERPDMQMAALQTSLRCMVVSGESSPIPVVVRQIKAKKVPLITARGDVKSLVAALEESMGNLKFKQDKKITPLLDTLRQSFNLKLLEQGLGIGA